MPEWYYPVVGVLTGGAIASFAAPWPLATVIGLLLYFLCLLVLDGVIGHRSGLTMNIVRAVRAGRQTIALKLVVTLGLVVGAVPELLFNWGWTPIVAGIAVVPAVILLGRRSDEELLAQAGQPA